MELEQMDGEEFLPDLPRLSSPSGIADINYSPCRFTTPLGVTVQAIPIFDVDGKLLVAVPHQAWHRAPASRALPRDLLAKPINVEVPVAQEDDRSLAMEDGSTTKTWLGLVKQSQLGGFSVDEDEKAFDYYFKDGAMRTVLPLAQGLVDAANDQFAFLSVPEVEQDLRQPPEDAGLASRVGNLESTLETMAQTLDRLSHGLAAQPGPSILKNAKTTKPAVQFPDLDPSVVASARSAGIDDTTLQKMQKMMSTTKPGGKLAEPAIAKSPSMTLAAKPSAPSHLAPFLDEEDDVGLAEESSSPSFQDALAKLTQIVDMLTEERSKKTKQTGVEAALETIVTTGTGDSVASGGSKRAAAARRALRTALLEKPNEISHLLERLMWEDLTSRTSTPGMPREDFSARAWVEHRSRIGAHKTAAFSAWAAAGILDDLVAGNVNAARARAGLLLLQLDQVAIDKGSWTLGAELTLESSPPFASLQQHVPPSIQDGEPPFSKLLDGRWAELALAHLAETDTYLAKRKTVGRRAMDDNDTANPTPKAKFKAKPKAKAKADPAAEPSSRAES